MRPIRYLVAAVILSVALSAALTAAPDTATTASAAPASAAPADAAPAPAAKKDKKKQKKKGYRPRPGPLFNSPGDFSINNKVLKAIRHTKRGSKIRIMTWNFNSWAFVRALRKAHERGVSVRIIMARSLAHEQRRNGPYRTLKRALKKQHRKQEMRSWFRVCKGSCRGRGGAMHAKMFLFSKTGKQPRVVMSSTGNLTGSAGKNQYNDMYTIRGSRKAYKRSIQVFNQAARDRPAPPVTYRTGPVMGWFQPRHGRKDLVMQMLKKVRCKGARGAGINGRTSIRIAQDVMLGKRGIRIAKKLRGLHKHGCNIRLVYSQLGGRIWQITKNIPRNHLVADRDGDGAYDIYLHMKAMAISGNYDGKRNTRIVYQGSENWSPLAAMSDEQGLIIQRDGVEKAYGKRINRLFGIHLKSVPLVTPRALRPKNPYVNMEG